MLLAKTAVVVRWERKVLSPSYTYRCSLQQDFSPLLVSTGFANKLYQHAFQGVTLSTMYNKALEGLASV